MTSIAVIGGGAAGFGAARTLLAEGFEVTIVESGPRLGGNCVGFGVRDADGREHVVDVGVSDFNRATFTEVSALIDDLGLDTHPIVGDAHFVSPSGESLWACQGGRWTFRRDPGDVPALLEEIDAFRTRALEVLRDDRFATWTVGRYLDHIGASRAFREVYLLPRAMGCFPMPDAAPEHYEVRSLVRFWNIHGIVSDVPADHRRVVGGMHRYAAAFGDWFEHAGGRVLCGTRVEGVQRDRHGVQVDTADSEGRRRSLRVDHVVFTGHASQMQPLLAAPSPAERAVLPRFAFQRARVVVHQDERLMGSERALWGGFHYVVPEGGLPRTRPTVTFHPNAIGSLGPEVPSVFVSMNPHVEPRADRVLATRSFLHPIGCRANARAAAALEALQGERRTWWAGSYLRDPFVHESALRSGIHVARRLVAAEAGERVEADAKRSTRLRPALSA